MQDIDYQVCLFIFYSQALEWCGGWTEKQISKSENRHFEITNNTLAFQNLNEIPHYVRNDVLFLTMWSKMVRKTAWKPNAAIC
jgi:hypothetical protein